MPADLLTEFGEMSKGLMPYITVPQICTPFVLLENYSGTLPIMFVTATRTFCAIMTMSNDTMVRSR